MGVEESTPGIICWRLRGACCSRAPRLVDTARIPRNGLATLFVWRRSLLVMLPSRSKEAEESTRAELWLPLWSSRVSLAELSHLFAEGRVQLGRRQARNAVEFALALANSRREPRLRQLRSICVCQAQWLIVFRGSPRPR